MPASALPIMVAKNRVRSIRRPSAFAASALSPTMQSRSPARVPRNAHDSNSATAIPTRKSGLTSSALRTCGTSDQKPNGMLGNCGAVGCT